MQQIKEEDFGENIILKTTTGLKTQVSINISITESGYMFKLNSNESLFHKFTSDKESYRLKIGFYKYLSMQKYNNKTKKYTHKHIKISNYVTKIITFNDNGYYYYEFPYLYGGYKNDEDLALFIKSFDVLKLVKIA